jgi:lysophospholipase L1-like esterase
MPVDMKISDRVFDGKKLAARSCAVFLMAFGVFAASVQAQELPKLNNPLSDEQVAAMAKLAIKGLDQEYPNKPSNVMAGPEGVLPPKAMHPAFYGCFDWHSSVHGHWMLVRLLRLYPNHPLAMESRQRLDAHLTQEAIAAETAYFEQKENRSFERMYGWAWLLRLVQELDEWPDTDSQRWRNNLRPLENKIVALTMEYLPKLTWPIRTGVHPDTGFALGQVLDYARRVKNADLENLVIARRRFFYANDSNYNDAFEPSGEDFFSTSLNEADLMRRILSPEEFTNWMTAMMPGLLDGSAARLLTPVEVSDVTDGKLVHLAGLDLSRAWTLNGIASRFPANDSRRTTLEKAAAAHLDAGLRYVFSGHYEGEHWLGTFAIYALTHVGIEGQSDTNISQFEPKPDRPEFANFKPIRAPVTQYCLIKNGDRLAIVGDSITEQKMYSRLIETYLTVCVPQFQVSVRQLGWSGEKCDGFLHRMERDCLTFRPTVATICYGMNDSRYKPYDEANGAAFRKNLSAIVDRFQQSGATVVVGSPGCAGKLASWVQSRTGTLEDHNLHLCELRNIAIEVSQSKNAAFADIFWPMYQAQFIGREKYASAPGSSYEVAGKDGIHPGWAGQTIMAYAFLTSLGLDGQIADFEIDMENGNATVSDGHRVLEQREGFLSIESDRYPVCANGPDDSDDSIRSGMTLVPFNDKLNRFMLRAKNLQYDYYKITWGNESKTVSASELASGINLAKEFPNNPFCEAYKSVDERVLAKQAFETQQVQKIFHAAKSDEDFQKAVQATEMERLKLVAAIAAAHIPVRHTLAIVPIETK